MGEFLLGLLVLGACVVTWAVYVVIIEDHFGE